MEILGIYSAMYSELKGKESVCFDILVCGEVNGHIIPTKTKKRSFEILVSDEDNAELCRNEIRDFLKSEGIVLHNIMNKFPIS